MSKEPTKEMIRLDLERANGEIVRLKENGYQLGLSLDKAKQEANDIAVKNMKAIAILEAFSELIEKNSIYESQTGYLQQEEESMQMRALSYLRSVLGT